MAPINFNIKNRWTWVLLAFAISFTHAQAAEPTNIQYNSQLRYCEAMPLPQKPSQNAENSPQPSQIVPVQALMMRTNAADSPSPGPIPPPVPGASNGPSSESATALSLQTALEWTLSSNPDLIAIRKNLQVSSDALAVARGFPESLNPTVSLDVRPWTFERGPEGAVQPLSTLFSVSWQQPLEFGHRTQYRTAMACASYSQTRWNILQAELLAMVQTYRFHQAAVYRYRKFCIATRLAEFNERLLGALRRQLEANQAAAADVVLAEVENLSMLQRVETARQEYIAALTELGQQIGSPRLIAGIQVGGELQSPSLPGAEAEDALVRSALKCRPEILIARAQASGSHAAVDLARAERIPIPSVGPVYEKDESNVSFYGVGVSSPIPVLNTGAKAVRQKESEHHRDLVSLEQTQEKVITQVKTTLLRCEEARRLLEQTLALTAPLEAQTARMERLYEAGQADLVKLFQVRQRLIEAENTRLDARWQVIQAYADLLSAVGTAPLIAGIPVSPGNP
jgi:outer membrane protein, heavy metal efflux system